MTFEDDELFDKPDQDVSGDEKPEAYDAGRVQVRIINRSEVPLKETKLKVLLEVTGYEGLVESRHPVDLVMVLDVSESMKKDKKLDKLKKAMQFLVRKLSPDDRLSVVKFSTKSQRLFPLRRMTDNSQDKILEEVNNLKPRGRTSITDGLETALQVLNGRRLKDGRVGAIMLMSDGAENINKGKATGLELENFAVHTFGFGKKQNPKVLQAIATKSKGGTFSDVQNEDNLSIAFSQCLGGLLSVVVQDLNLIIKEVDEKSKIENVSAGNYTKENESESGSESGSESESESESENSSESESGNESENGSVTVSFRELYNREVRKVIVALLLPKVDNQTNPDVLQVSYTYSRKGQKPFESPTLTATVNRTETALEAERDEVVVEEKRLETVNVVRRARALAEQNKLEEAKKMLDAAKNSLADVDADDPKQTIRSLVDDLQELHKLMIDPTTYEKQGRPYALAFESSHDNQRYAARGDNLEIQRAFATPRMDTYLNQAKKFIKNPTKLPPSLADDVKEERATHPLGPFIGALTFYINNATQAPKSIGDILNNVTRRTT